MKRTNPRAAFYSSRHKHRLIQNQTMNDLECLNQISETDRNVWQTEHNTPIPSCSVAEQCAWVDTDCATPNTMKTPIGGSQLEVPNNDVSMNGAHEPVNTTENENKISEELANNSEAVPLRNKLCDWAVRYNINQNAVSALLSVLKCYGHPELPKDCRALLRTPRSSTVVQVSNGNYCHFGLQQAVLKITDERRLKGLDVSSVNLLVNIDGLPLSRSANSSLWPILCSDAGINKVYIVGAFFGKCKPGNANEFLQMFADELTRLIKNGIHLDSGEKCTVRLYALICDAPAKAFVLRVKSHSGYNSCTKCTIEGEFIDNCVCFSTKSNSSRPRTDQEFLNYTDEDYHLGNTILSNIPYFGPVTSVPLDYMHLICLGVTKKIIAMWMKGPLDVRLPSTKIKEVSAFLEELKMSVPKEFVRKPRSLSEINYWKATEYRTFLLYVGPLVLKSVLKTDLYINFMTLHAAIRLLTSTEFVVRTECINYAESLLKHFVESFETLYGENKISHNVHNLLHICEDVRKYGALDEFSAFKFENHMSSIKRVLRKSERPLEQLYNRYAEMEFCTSNNIQMTDYSLGKLHSEGPLPTGLTADCWNQYKIYSGGLFFISSGDIRNNCFLLKNGSFVLIENIIQNNTDKTIFVIGKYLTTVKDLYTSPCNSSDLGIHIVDVTDNLLHMWNINEIKKKMWKIKFNSYNVVFPLLHL